MSELGNIKKSYGKQINVAVANTNGSVLEHSSGIPANTLIVAAPIVNGVDTGEYSLFCTDVNGTPVRLTYMIKLGNGLNVDTENPDVIKFDIDTNTLSNNSGLSFNIENLIDTNTLYFNDLGKLSVNTQNLSIASAETLGVASIDNNSLNMIDGQLYVETSNLDKANNEELGIVTSDNNTINISDNGVISVITDRLPYATVDTYGTVLIDNSTVIVNNNSLTIKCDNLQKASENNVGVVKVDNSSIVSNNGVLSIDTTNISSADASKYGVAKYDKNSLTVNNNVASVKDYDKIIAASTELKNLIDELNVKTTELNELLNSDSLNLRHGIYSLTCSNTTITDLAKPVYLEEAINMRLQRVYVVMNIICSCDFTIDVKYENNMSPDVELSQINYNDEFSFQDYEGLLETYPSTDMKEKRVVLLFNAKNFCSSTAGYSETTNIIITIASKENKVINKQLKYSIVRYNSFIKVEEKPVEVATVKYRYEADQDTSKWKLSK